jgi:four helix bundle suffix protein
MAEGTPLHEAPPVTQPATQRQLRHLQEGIEHKDPLIAANVMIGLIKLTNYLLDQQLRRLERDFVMEGGLRERMTCAWLAHRAKQNYRP